MALAADAYTRRTGSGAYWRSGKYAQKLRREGGGPPRVRSDRSQDLGADYDLEEVKAHRRRHPHPPASSSPRRPKNVKVHWYMRRKPDSPLGPLGPTKRREPRWYAKGRESDAEREWIDYLASYYGVSRSKARRMERGSRP